MKVSVLIETLSKLEQNSEVRVTILKDGWRPFGPMKEIIKIDPVLDQDTGEVIYSIPVSVEADEVEYLINSRSQHKR